MVALHSAAIAQTQVIAHRGYWKHDGSTQNSITSLTLAAQIKAYGSECDVWTTVDNKLIVNHDRLFKGLDMNSNKSKEILALKLDNGEELPTFKEYLKAAKKLDVKLIIEIKSKENIKSSRMIARYIKRYRMKERVEVIVWTTLTGDEMIRRLPEVPVHYLSGDMTPQQLKDKGYAGLDYYTKIYKKNPQWIKEARELGLKTNVWTVNTDEDIRYFIDAGVDFITTDYPEKVAAMLK